MAAAKVSSLQRTLEEIKRKVADAAKDYEKLLGFEGFFVFFDEFLLTKQLGKVPKMQKLVWYLWTPRCQRGLSSQRFWCITYGPKQGDQWMMISQWIFWGVSYYFRQTCDVFDWITMWARRTSMQVTASFDYCQNVMHPSQLNTLEDSLYYTHQNTHQNR